MEVLNDSVNRNRFFCAQKSFDEQTNTASGLGCATMKIQ